VRLQRIYVTTAEGTPSFLVYEIVSDEFIDEVIEWKFGRRDGGARHEWEAFTVEEVRAEAA
jgi:hypothetical protein